MFTFVTSSQSKSKVFLPLALSAAVIFAVGTAWSADRTFIGASDTGTELMDALAADSSGPASVAVASSALASPVVASVGDDFDQFTGDSFSSTDFMDSVEQLSPAPDLPPASIGYQALDNDESTVYMDSLETLDASE